jgi:hypothetical protein
MQKVYDTICWAAVITVGVFFVIIFLARYVFGLAVGFWWLFTSSSLPRWVLFLAGIAIAAGYAYLVRGMIRRRMPVRPRINNSK